MNVNFGIILRKSIIDNLLSPLPPEFRSWGDEEVQIDERRLSFAALENIEFQLFPVTQFVMDHLPAQLKGEELTYALITGKALDGYEEWVGNNDTAFSELHPFEKGLLEMIRRARETAIIFAPEGERLGEFVNVVPTVAISLLRLNVRNLAESKGFMATVARDDPRS